MDLWISATKQRLSIQYTTVHIQVPSHEKRSITCTTLHRTHKTGRARSRSTGLDLPCSTFGPRKQSMRPKRSTCNYLLLQSSTSYGAPRSPPHTLWLLLIMYLAYFQCISGSHTAVFKSFNYSCIQSNFVHEIEIINNSLGNTSSQPEPT